MVRDADGEPALRESVFAPPRGGACVRDRPRPLERARHATTRKIMNKGTAIVGFLLCFVAGMGLMWGVDRGGVGGTGATAEAFSTEAWSDEDAVVPVSSKDPVWGSRTAPVTMVVWSDFQCPFCQKVETSITSLKQKY